MDDLQRCAASGDELVHVPPVNRRAAAAARATVLNPRPILCRKGVCPAVIGDAIVYRPAGHLTDTFARTLTTWMARRLPALPPPLQGSPARGRAITGAAEDRASSADRGFPTGGSCHAGREPPEGCHGCQPDPSRIARRAKGLVIAPHARLRTVSARVRARIDLVIKAQRGACTAVLARGRMEWSHAPGRGGPGPRVSLALRPTDRGGRGHRRGGGRGAGVGRAAPALRGAQPGQRVAGRGAGDDPWFRSLLHLDQREITVELHKTFGVEPWM